MPLARIKLGLSHLNLPKLADLTHRVAKAMGLAHVTFPNPPVPVATLDAAADDTMASYTAAVDAHKAAEVLMMAAHQKIRDLRTSVTQTAHYVVSIAKGDAVVITSAAFDTQNAPVPAGILGPPLALGVTAGDHPGELHEHWDPVKGAHTYGVEINLGDPQSEADWHIWAIAHGSKCTLTKLPPGKLVWSRVFVDTTAGNGPRSSPVSKLAP